MKPAWGKLAYGLLFTVLLPLGLWQWSSHLPCSFPAIHAPRLGLTLLAGGVGVIWMGMWRLWHEGGGLPMNAYPPSRIAGGGIYALLPHPIYCGFFAVAAGTALKSGSAGVLWAVTPLCALGCLALVLGYEGPDLDRRFGNVRPSPWIRLPRGEGPMTLSGRIGAMLAALVPWAIAYLAVKALGVAGDSFNTRMAWEWNIPISPRTMPIYASIYFVVPLAFLVCADRASMRRLVVVTWVASGLNTLIYLVAPATAVFRAPDSGGWLADWLAWEQRMASPAAGSFPAFHVTWAVICAAFFFGRVGKLPCLLCWLWCIALAASCLSTGMHTLADVLAGAVTGAICWRAADCWRAMLGVTERLSNNWRTWQFGPLRVINHALWSGLAGFTLMLMVGLSARPEHLSWGVAVAAASLVGAGLWAQWVEGSSALLRPFGYYGSLVAGLLAFAVVAGVGGPVDDLMAAFAVASPWAQAVGRLRCVVQGCCHGRPVDWGIRVMNAHSRVVKLAGFAGTPIHPTPLYSILANVVMGILLARMRVAGAGAFQIAGAYLLLAGLARFVEEAYRGEPQTISVGGLPIYQWLAIGSLLLGMFVMTLPPKPLPPMHWPSVPLAVISILWGLICAFAMSMDFPQSNRKFSRLTG